jgi:hypothetical protein
LVWESQKDTARSLPIPAKITNVRITGTYKNGFFATIPNIYNFENSPVNFETHRHGVGYRGGGFGTENDEKIYRKCCAVSGCIDTRARPDIP